MRTKTAYCEKPAAEQPLSDDEITRQLIENAVNPGARYPNEATPTAEPPAGVEANAGVGDEPAGDNQAVQQALQEHGAFDRHRRREARGGLT
jgi:hypothetical protein